MISMQETQVPDTVVKETKGVVKVTLRKVRFRQLWGQTNLKSILPLEILNTGCPEVPEHGNKMERAADRWWRPWPWHCLATTWTH